MTTEFIELAGKINQQMPYHCVSALGADLRYHDPTSPRSPTTASQASRWRRRYKTPTLALIACAHPGVDHDTVLTRARLIVDLRGVTCGSRIENVVWL